VNKKTSGRGLFVAVTILCSLVLLFGVARLVRLAFGHSSFATGWLLLTLMLFLAMYNSRKRISMLPLGKASTWLQLHVIGGFATFGFFWLHTGRIWPSGGYEHVLALLFYLVGLSGVCGWLLQAIYPRVLTSTGIEVIYERIPTELADLREQAEALMRNSNSVTLAQYYHDQIQWFFSQPRFLLHHLLGNDKARTWSRQQQSQVQRYLNSHENEVLQTLGEMMNHKLELDVHYALQSVMKGWLLVHVPLAVALVLLALWHTIVVHVYAG
jgi:hypothetical protein